MRAVPCLLWALLIAIRFLLLSSGFGQASPFVLREGNAVVKEQVIAFAQAPSCLINVLSPGYLALPVVFSWIGGFVVVHFQWWTAHVVASGVVGLGKYGKCIMHF